MLIHKFSGMSQHHTVQVNILPACQISVKASAKLDQRCNGSFCRHRTLIWLQNSADRLEQRGFSGAIRTDQPPGLSLFYLQRNILQCKKLLKHQLVFHQFDRVFLQIVDLLARQIKTYRHTINVYYIVVHFFSFIRCTK